MKIYYWKRVEILYFWHFIFLRKRWVLSSHPERGGNQFLLENVFPSVGHVDSVRPNVKLSDC